ncbi:GNAT family N-acetyltransferase [Clostridium beijerinckii]|uniref:GNAT family N-acetyltransferase n=1 Tax=Clostridium beijerinckii TaxID=1520 RepID=A0A7X9XPQ7_CLOBE|nr:GNAT family N-acetyltransferase [Clostridium beijerinckii]NMF05568.1 GNAT family N-acetyltransferase [Clostridium beijerinckii]
MNYIVKRTTSEDVDFKFLEKQLDDELFEIYGDMQSNYSSHNTVIDLKTIIIFVDQKPIGCGCLKFLDCDLAEVKRVYVSLEYRNRGVAKIIVKEIEKLAIESNIKNIILQTGSRQKAAVNLYESMGYKLTENYGPYVNDNNSICMKKIV